MGLLFLVFTLGFAQEALMTYRMKLRKERAKGAVAGSYSDVGAEVASEASPIITRPTEPQMLGLTGLYGLNLLMSYLLMLAAMTYNVGIFIAAILGLCAGHHVFYREPPMVSMDHGLECCPSQ